MTVPVRDFSNIDTDHTDHTGTCPRPVGRATMIHRWDNLTFLHWAYDPSEVQRLLPAGLAVETFDGLAWVALVPFEMQVRAPHAGLVPWLSRFPETNVRTYVRAEDGTTGVWFLSLDASRLAAVVAARSTYLLPYHWSHMTITRDGDRVSYRSRRRWPGPTGATSDVAIDVGAPFGADELTPFDHWLTARWRLYSVNGRGRVRSARAAHDPWPLHHARVVRVNDELVAATGLRPPEGAPVVHWSPGVEVRVGFPHTVLP